MSSHSPWRLALIAVAAVLLVFICLISRSPSHKEAKQLLDDYINIQEPLRLYIEIGEVRRSEVSGISIGGVLQRLFSWAEGTALGDYVNNRIEQTAEDGWLKKKAAWATLERLGYIEATDISEDAMSIELTDKGARAFTGDRYASTEVGELGTEILRDPVKTAGGDFRVNYRFAFFPRDGCEPELVAMCVDGDLPIDWRTHDPRQSVLLFALSFQNKQGMTWDATLERSGLSFKVAACGLRYFDDQHRDSSAETTPRSQGD